MTESEAKDLYEHAHAIIRSDPPKALIILEDLKNKLPSADTYHDLIYLHCFSKNYTIVDTLFADYYLYEGNTCRYYHDYGYYLYRIGQIESAVWYFTKALTINEKDDRVLMNLGLCKLKIGEYEQAEHCFKGSFTYKKSYKTLICYAVSRLIQGKELDRTVITLFKNSRQLVFLSRTLCYAAEAPKINVCVATQVMEILLRNE